MTDKPLTTEELDALAALEKAATPGPWTHFNGNVDSIDMADGKPVIHWQGFDSADGTKYRGKRNAAFIVGLRNAAPRLIEQARREAESELVKDRAIAISSGAVAVLHEKLAVAESALSTTRERLEIFITGAKKIINDYVTGDHMIECALSELSQIAAKAGTGGKGEE